MTKNKSKVNRRSVLRSASASVGIAGGAQIVSGDTTARSGSTVFSEVMLIHDIDIPENFDYNFPYWTVNDFSKSHFVNYNNSTIYANRDGNIDMDMAEHMAVVSSDDYFAPPDTIGGRATSMIRTGLHQSYRVSSALSIKDDEYSRPEIPINIEDSHLRMEIQGENKKVPSGNQTKFSLSPRQVTVEVYEYLGDNTIEPETRRNIAPERNYKDISLTITPEVHVRNYGELDVANVRSTSPIPHDRVPRKPF
jgi:hypothetical protein